MTVNSTRDFIPPEPFEGQNYKPRYARPSASLRDELFRKYFPRVRDSGNGKNSDPDPSFQTLLVVATRVRRILARCSWAPKTSHLCVYALHRPTFLLRRTHLNRKSQAWLILVVLP